MRLGLIWLVLLIGCTGTPVTEPPNAVPPPNPDLVSSFPGTGVTDIFGAAGSVEPGLSVWAVDLGTADPPTTVVADSDGAFQISFQTAARVVRLQARDPITQGRSTPLDWIVESSQPRPQPCAVIDVEAVWLNPSSVEGREIAIVNPCSDDLTIDTLRLRQSNPAFAIQTPTPVNVGSGAGSSILVTYDPAAGPGEDLLLIESTVSGDAWAVHLIGFPDG